MFARTPPFPPDLVSRARSVTERVRLDILFITSVAVEAKLSQELPDGLAWHLKKLGLQGRVAGDVLELRKR